MSERESKLQQRQQREELLKEELLKRAAEEHPHPGYGPCDAFGGDGKWCLECNLLPAHLSSPGVQGALRRTVEYFQTNRSLMRQEDATTLRTLLLEQEAKDDLG